MPEFKFPWGGDRSGSKPGETSSEERQQIIVLAIVAGVSAFLTYIVDHTADLGLGALGPLLAAALPVLLEAIRKWATDTRKPRGDDTPPVPPVPPQLPWPKDPPPGWPPTAPWPPFGSLPGKPDKPQKPDFGPQG